MATKQTVKEKRTLVKFGYQDTIYQAGIGYTTNYVLLTVTLGFDEETEQPITTDSFYCEWQNSFGNQAIKLEADNVLQPARIRIPFVQALYELLTTKDVKIYKNGLTDKAHTFVLNSGVDNYMEQQKMMEFQVKKEGKK